jgi:hypothetical protein
MTAHHPVAIWTTVAGSRMISDEDAGQNAGENAGSGIWKRLTGRVGGIRTERARWCLTVIVLELLVACGGGGKTFTTDQLEALVLQPSEAPSGTTYVGQASGPADLDLFSQGIQEARRRFAELGFEGGYVAVFSSADGSPTIGSGALVFEDASAALKAVDVQRSVVVPKATTGSKALSVSDLGERAFAFTFASGPLQEPGAIYFFQVGNAIFVVSGSGVSLRAEDLLTVARLVAARAEE